MGGQCGVQRGHLRKPCPGSVETEQHQVLSAAHTATRSCQTIHLITQQLAQKNTQEALSESVILHPGRLACSHTRRLNTREARVNAVKTRSIKGGQLNIIVGDEPMHERPGTPPKPLSQRTLWPNVLPHTVSVGRCPLSCTNPAKNKQQNTLGQEFPSRLPGSM